MSTITTVVPQGTQATLVHLGDLDLLLQELGQPAARTQLKNLGIPEASANHIAGARARCIAHLEARQAMLYERTRQRYGRAVATVRDRVCLGCYMTLPTTARPRFDNAATLPLCESCGRFLYWGP